MCALKIRKWTKEEIDFALEMLNKGMSAGVTAQEMKSKGIREDCGGVTRNAIISVWHRYSGAPRSKTPRINLNLKNKNRLKDIAARNSNISVAEIPADGIEFADLRVGSCRFPYGEGTDSPLRYCGHAVDYSRSESYCKMHYDLCYRPVRVK